MVRSDAGETAGETPVGNELCATLGCKFDPAGTCIRCGDTEET